MRGRSGPEPGTLAGAHDARLRTLRWDPPGEVRGRVVVVHGLGEHAGRYDLLAEALNGAGWAVLGYDQRSHGESEGRRGHVPDFQLLLEDLHRALHEARRILPGGGEPFVVGHSMGGLVTLRYLQVHRHALPGAVLSAPWLATAQEVPLWKRLLEPLAYRFAPSTAFPSDIESELLTSDPERQRAYDDDALVSHGISPAFWRAVRGAQELALSEGADPETPTLVLVPGADRLVDPDRTATWARERGGPSVEVRELEGMRHEPFNEVGRERVFDMLLEWMDARAPGRTGGPPPGTGNDA